MYLQAKTRKRRWLGAAGAPSSISDWMDIAAVGAAGGIAAGGMNPLAAVLSPDTSCSTWDFFFNPTAWQSCEAALATAQIQSVPINAAAAGYSPNVVAVAQATADAQTDFVPSDVANMAQYYGAGQIVTPGSIPTWMYIAGAVAAGLLVMAAFK
jgi:hypothetical protein